MHCISLSPPLTHIHTALQQMDEFRGLAEEQYYEWVAQYLVMKRASIEPNFHNLYMSFLNSLGSSVLRKSVLIETFRNIRVRPYTLEYPHSIHLFW